MTGIEAALGAQAAKNIAPGLGRALADLGKTQTRKLLVKYTQCFTKHEESSYARATSIKNILYKDQSVLLREKYVHTHFCRSRRQSADLSDTELVNGVKSACKYVVSGTAGAGKTMFLRYTVLELVDRKLEFQVTPIYVELRYLTKSDLKKGFIRAIFDRVSSSDTDEDFERFRLGLGYGLFAFLFDAVDEVNPIIRDAVTAGIRDMITRYRRCSFIVTTRPDPYIESMQDVSVVYTAAMSKDQIKEVITKLDYEEGVKEKLLGELDKGLFEKHQEFLSNPLLATIMLLTYDQAADIPTKITSFYELAFQTLYQRHDAAKDTYKRGHAAGLPMDEFEKLFSTFCFITLAKRKYEFSDKELKDFFNEALSFAGCGKPVDAVIRDSVEAVCLLQPEGLQYVFVHRTFQEYFAAVFASRYRGENHHEVIDACVDHMGAGNFVPLLDEIDRDVLDYQWLRPKIEAWLKTVGRLRLDSPTGLKKFMEGTIRRFTLNEDDGTVRGIGLDGPNSLDWMIPADQSNSTNLFLSKTLFGKSISVRSSFKWDGPPDRKGLDNFRARIGLDAKSSSTRRRFMVGPEDAPFLVKTQLPAALGELREAYRKALKGIELRQRQKVKTADSLLKGKIA